MSSINTINIFCKNLLALLKQNEHSSMRNLSTSIQLLNRMPSAMLPVVKHYIEYLLQELQSKDKS